ncbi:MAG: hypothetical protein EXR77_16395 [Myxococcales bacterium]|nr:hypothetical protein [Myxococcales bacterium]
MATKHWQAVTGSVPLGTIGCHAGWLPNLQGGRAVVFAGQGLSVGMDTSTWLYDPAARSFALYKPTTTPPSRRDGATASDIVGNRVLVFGGQTAPQPNAAHTNDFWQFDGSNWSKVVATGSKPSPRRYPATAFDPKRRWLVVFSGTNEVKDFEDLWLFDASTDHWTQLSVVEAPEVRSFGAMIFDSGSQAFYLFGGFTSPGMKGQADGYRLVL